MQETKQKPTLGRVIRYYRWHNGEMTPLTALITAVIDETKNLVNLAFFNYDGTYGGGAQNVEYIEENTEANRDGRWGWPERF